MSLHRLRHRAPRRRSFTAILLLLVGLFALSGGSFAGSLSLAWDGVTGASGYRIGYDTASGSYSASLDAGSKTSATVSGLTEGTRYYFAVQAYNATTTSAYSNEVNAVVPTTAPVASFTANGSTASSITVTQGQTVSLVDTSTGTVASRSWSLGDGTTATTATVVKSYCTTGNKTVKLSVTGAGVTRTASKTINVTAAAPVASFSASATSGTAPLTVTFNSAASTGCIDSRSWSFGNGVTKTGTATSASTTYTQAGTYTVSLTVTGSGGSNTVTKTGFITVGSTSGGGGGGGSGGVSGLVAAYGFEETGGSQTLDASGNANHGTLADVTRSASGKFGRALAFNGTNSWVTVKDSASLDLTNGLTLSAWVYPTTWASRWSTVVAKQKPDGFVYSLFSNSSQGKPYSTLDIRGTYHELDRGSHLPTNTWTHLAVTYDGSYHRLLVNGAGVGQAGVTGPISVSGGPLRIGGHAWASEFFQGLIDEVRVYNRALTTSEIKTDSGQAVVK